MSHNPLRFFTSFWDRSHSATDTVKASSSDDNGDAAQATRQTKDTLEREQVRREAQDSELLHATFINNSQVPSFNETSEGSQEHKQGHVRYASIDTDCTLNHENEADDHMHQSQAAGDRQTNVPLGEDCEEQVPEVSSDDGRLPNKHTEDPSHQRRKLTPKRQMERKVKKTSPKYPGKFEVMFEKSTDDDPLPEGYLYTYRDIRYVKTSMNLTGSCGAAQGLHRLICGHWISTPTPQPCGVSCYSPLYENESFRCTECCDMVRIIINTKLTAPERAKLAHARSGLRIFYIALAVEYVAKHAPTMGGLTEAVLHALDHTGRSCERPDGPADYEVDIEQTVRETRQRAKQERFKAESTLMRREKRERDDEMNGAVSLAAQSKKRRMGMRRDGKLFVRQAPDSMRTSSSDKSETEGDVKGARSGATSTKVLDGGATRSPHLQRSGQRLVLKRGGQDAEGGQEREAGKRRRVL